MSVGTPPNLASRKFFLISLIFTFLALFYLLIIPFYEINGKEYSFLALPGMKIPPEVGRFVGALVLALFSVIGAFVIHLINLGQLKKGKKPKIGYVILILNILSMSLLMGGQIRLKRTPSLMFGFIWLLLATSFLLIGFGKMNSKAIAKVLTTPVSISGLPPGFQNQISKPLNTPAQAPIQVTPQMNTQMATQMPVQNAAPLAFGVITPVQQTIMPSFHNPPAGSQSTSMQTVMPHVAEKKSAQKQVRCPECGDYVNEVLLDRIEKGYDGYCERCGALIHAHTSK